MCVLLFAVVLLCAVCAAEIEGGLEQQMRVLSKQVTALLDRRQEDIQLIEDNMRKTLAKSQELVQVKEEMKNLRYALY